MDDWSEIPPFEPPNSHNAVGGSQSGQEGPETFPDEIELVKGIVGKYFPIYDVRIQFNTISLYCNIDPEQLEGQFDLLRKEMKSQRYIPILKYEKGEYVVHVVRQPKMKFRSINLNYILFIVTIITTTLAGSLLWIIIINAGAEDINLGDMFLLGNIANGAFYFALPLMLILGIHEMAHYYAAKKHGIAASLPFFIPVPPIFIPPLGTMGALISIREPIPNNKALLDIGIAGPIAGFLVAIPITIIGLMLSSPLEAVSSAGVVEGGTILIGDSFLFVAIKEFMPIPENILLHPTAFAGWVGLFVTALNLLPAGQLDGGHIARALLGDKSRYASYAAFGVMLLLGLQFTGWLIFAMIIMFMGLRHPPPLNDVTKLDDFRKMVGVSAAVILVLCFVPIPIDYEEPVYGVDYLLDPGDGNLTPAYSMRYSSPLTPVNETVILHLNNTGNVDARIDINISSSNSSLAAGRLLTEESPNGTLNFSVVLKPTHSLNLTLIITVMPNVTGNVSIVAGATYYYAGGELDPEDFGLNAETRVRIDIRQ